MVKFHRNWKSACLRCTVKLKEAFSCIVCILRTHISIRLRPVFEKTTFECEDFFPSPESLLPWQQQKIRSKWSWASEHGSAEQTSAVANCVTSAAAAAFSLQPLSPPFSPSSLTSLPSFNIRFLFSGAVVQLVSHPSQQSDRLTFLSLFSRQFFPNSLLLLSPFHILSTAFTSYCLSLPSSMLLLYCKLVCLVFRKTDSDRAASVLSVLVAYSWGIEDQCAMVPPYSS